jgi:hypothetical protein
MISVGSIIFDSSTRVLIQGITGKEGIFWAKRMKAYGLIERFLEFYFILLPYYYGDDFI